MSYLEIEKVVGRFIKTIRKLLRKRYIKKGNFK